ncbi:MAG: DUF1674 domain-containing protein [Alphaproteobacteria bacterium]|nr:DUF1674 domain-containing protein [Alphaproteobacteria bacterium]
MEISADPPRSPAPAPAVPASATPPPAEIGGPKRPEPTRCGDWEFGGHCTDF